MSLISSTHFALRLAAAGRGWPFRLAFLEVVERVERVERRLLLLLAFFILLSGFGLRFG